YGLGEAGEGKNITHQQKKLNDEELREFRARFGIPIADSEVGDAPFYRPPEDSPEMRYLRERRAALGGSIPERRIQVGPIEPPTSKVFDDLTAQSVGRDVSTTMIFVRLLSQLLKDKNIGDLIVPIVPDEARTFGMESLFRQVGIYSHIGQRYEPVDRESLLYYKEATDGQILEEGITEAGSMASFIAAGTAYATHGVNTIPFFIFYSMFGFQRIGDLIWAAGDMRARGFMLGATAGRTTLAGEGLQHQDGHSHLLAMAHPNVIAYDPAYAYEIATIIREGIDRMYVDQIPAIYYLTLENETYEMPDRPKGCEEGILKGMYELSRGGAKRNAPVLLGSGAILNETLKAQRMLADEHGVDAAVWSVTSHQQLYREAIAVERENRLHPTRKPKRSTVETALAHAPVVVAASDYSKLLPSSLAQWIPGRLASLGTDGFGRSEGREELRDHFEVDARHVVVATLHALAQEGKVDASKVQATLKAYDIDPQKIDPATA
ncbi:MAG: pyruvate dehydrogenase (acetyl-transferring), homodimeric type, partial [Planctomycetota bacterium]|nr:pyruvate dehydrogenase (acetyl-transferring), homodimeric type [Planctomycetota bacterium]